MKEFFKKQGVMPSWKTYFVTAMGAMAQGLFCTLLLVIKHRSNIRRLLTKTESKLELKKDLSNKFEDEDF